MINKIIDGINEALHDAFGAGYKIHNESIKQGFQEPCFFVQCLNPTNDLVIGKRYFRKNLFCVQYFPSSSEPNAECNAAREKLFDCLEYITVSGDLTRGANMRGEIVDGVLSFFVNFDMYVYKVEEGTPMETLDMKTDMKG